MPSESGLLGTCGTRDRVSLDFQGSVYRSRLPRHGVRAPCACVGLGHPKLVRGAVTVRLLTICMWTCRYSHVHVYIAQIHECQCHTVLCHPHTDRMTE